MNAVRSNTRTPIQAMSARMWSAGFLPAKYSGVSLRAGSEPVLFINNPDGVSPEVRRRMLDAVSELNQLQHQTIGDPETLTRIAQYEMAYRMQASVPELTDLSSEPAAVYDLYGEDARRPGSFAQCCLTTRRLLERGDTIRADLAERLGRAFQRHRPSAEPVPGRRPGVLRPRSGPEAARHARRHAARLGRRIRPYDLLARQPDANELRPRSPPSMLHDVDGRGGCQGRNVSTARPTISRTTS